MASIINNTGALGINRSFGASEKGLNNTLRRLSTGSRINRAFEDAAGLQISNNLRADIRINNQARQNANIGLGISNIADGALSGASGLLERAAEISVQAASGTTSDAGREALNDEFQNILQELDSLGANTKFDGENIFGGSFDVRTGEEASQTVNVSADPLSSGDLGLAGADLLSEGGASTALAGIQNAIESVSSRRGEIGATQQRLSTTINSLDVTSENIQAAESQIRDADVAAETVRLTKFKILAQSSISAQAQSNNLQAGAVLSLLRG
jgi:flagellin